MDNPNLYLVGINHLDFSGKERLDSILNHVQPDIIALEFHEEREESGTEQKESEQKIQEIQKCVEQSELDLTENQLATMIGVTLKMDALRGYEYRSSKSFVNTNPGARLKYIDLPLFTGGKAEFEKGFNEIMALSLQDIANNYLLAEPLLTSLALGSAAYEDFVKRGIEASYQDTDATEILQALLDDPQKADEMKKRMSPQAVQSYEKMMDPQRDETMTNNIKALYDGDNKLMAIVGVNRLSILEKNLKELNPKVMTLMDHKEVPYAN